MTESPTDSLKASWTTTQYDIASRVADIDDNDWHTFLDTEVSTHRPIFIAGADISFPTDPTADHAVATIAVVKLDGNKKTELIFSQSNHVIMDQPYIPSFLGFREAPIIQKLLAQLPSHIRSRIDCLLLDGNGVLHPRKAGLACHVGVLENLPTIGVSKALLCVDGLIESDVRQSTAQCSDPTGYDVIGNSGFLWGKAILTGNAVSKPIYVSVGHRVSLKTASRLVRALCVYRVPEPVRYADQHSRALIRGTRIDVNKSEGLEFE